MNNKLTPQAIKDLRKQAKMNQKELAEYCGCEKGTVNRWEVGKSRPSQLALRQLHRLQRKVEENGNKP